MRTYLMLCVILLGAFLLRVYSLNWDSSQHQHPDERFLTMVVSDVRLPSSLKEYVSPALSPLNPHNAGHAFYVYGTLPVTIVKIVSNFMGLDDYHQIVLVGRAISAILDSLVVLMVFIMGRLLFRRHSAALWASFFYAIAVLPIQLSHFFVADTYLNTFMSVSILCALLFVKRKNYIWLIVSGLSMSGALGSKISAILGVPLVLFILLTGVALELWENRKNRLTRQQIYTAFLWLYIYISSFILLLYFGLRLAAPYYFNTGMFFDIRLSPDFIANIRELNRFSDPDSMFPPSLQWYGKAPLWYAFSNILYFGLGIPLTGIVLIGFITFLSSFFKKNRQKVAAHDVIGIILAIWSIVIFFYLSTRPVKTMRYFIYLYPLFVLFGGYGVSRFGELCARTLRQKIVLTGVVAVSVSFWTVLFMSVYTRPHTRVSASEWIYQNVPQGSVLAVEAWDDALPLPLGQRYAADYTLIEVPIYDPDTPEKQSMLFATLAQADYYIISSNRGWGSITNVPDRYPITTHFYKTLFEERAGYSLVAAFSSYPSLRYLGIPLEYPDEWADEAFTVYDHPRVMIFEKREKDYQD